MTINQIMNALYKGSTITIKFEDNQQNYVYKNHIADIQVGDKVFIKTNKNGIRAVEVIKVGDENDLDIEHDIEYRWVLSKVDIFSDYEKSMKKDEELKNFIIDKQKANIRQQVREQIINQIGFDITL